jgi:hypothetical protein
VLLCSKLAYLRIIETCAQDNNPRVFDYDFAILEYPGCGGTCMVKARLNGEFFEVNSSQRHRGMFPALDDGEMKGIFEGLKALRPGEINREHNVMRWDVDLQLRPDDWTHALGALFGDVTPDSLHLVFFSGKTIKDPSSKQRLLDCIAEINAMLTELKEGSHEGIRLQDAWFGECDARTARDERTGGELLTGEAKSFPYVLMMRFPDRRSLDNWYSLPEHSAIRRKLYEAFDGQVAEMFSKIDGLAAGDAKGRRSIYEKIEKQAAAFIKRRDYRDAATLREIVAKKPFRPKIKF